MYEWVDVVDVQVLDGYKVHLTFQDGTTGIVDLEPHLQGPVFEPLRDDRQLFQSVRVDPEAGTIVWPNGADIAPDTLYQETKMVSASFV
ncbi:MAG: DUF2442 domain-containing protein [Chloroflexota bacterium]|nr:DUF2442 domain-containing protein [Chloroflexota bacterium]